MRVQMTIGMRGAIIEEQPSSTNSGVTYVTFLEMIRNSGQERRHQQENAANRAGIDK